MIDYKLLPEILRKLRLSRGMRQQDIADALYISRSAYSYYELGATRPRLEILEKLESIYGVSEDIFLHPGMFPELKMDRMRPSRKKADTIDTVGNLSPKERSLIVLLRNPDLPNMCEELLDIAQKYTDEAKEMKK